MTASAILVVVAGSAPALAQGGQQPPEQQPAEKADEQKKDEVKDPAEEPVRLVEEVIVKGFRAALEQSVELKRLAVNARDSIVTEDIGKMPDLNLAEALQRVPGVAIVREGGEGRQMSLRGLGAEFTHVTLNGMEVPASVGGLDSLGGVNRGRSFDFNVFSADLFSRIDVNKTSTASIEEGGVAGAVDMFTMRPLSQPGFRSSFAVQGGYNDVSEKYDPRLTGTISATNEAGTFGFVASAAYTGRTPFQDGFGTVRWGQPDRPFRGNQTSLSTAVVNSLWYPRLPRQDSFRHDQERLGLSGGVQFRPSSKLEAGVNWVHSTFKATTNSYNSFAQFRRSAPWGFDTITPTAVTAENDGNSSYAIAGSFQNVSLRTESRQNADETKFNQLTADFKYEFNPNLVVTGMVGRAQSKYLDDYFRANIETPGTTFSYDFTANPNVASIHYGLDVTNPENYVLQNNELFQQFNVDRTNNTARLDLEWGLSGRKHVVKFGGIYNDREVDSRQAIQNVNPPGLAPISRVFSYVDVGGFGSGTTLDFLVLDFAKAKAEYGYGTFGDVRGPGRTTWLVLEKTAGAYVDYTLFTQLDGRGFRVNAGARFVNTKTEATGWLSQTLSNTEDNSYNDLLPAVNVAYDATSKLVLRVAASRSLTRPSLASLAPIKTYSDVNFTVAGGNSQLEPLEADAVDVGAEWYFAEASVLGVNVFYKDVKSFISSPQTSEPLRAEDFAAVQGVYPTQPALLNPSLIWTYRTSANVDGTTLKGFEVAYQQPFKFLPGWAANLGFVGNYSYVDAKTQVTRSGASVEVPLQGLSKNSFNATLYYEVAKGGVRLSLNGRDDYITNNTGSNGNVSEATTGPVRLDMSAFFHLTDAISLTLEGVNLTNEFERLYTTGDGTMNLGREYNTTGRQFYAGARINF